jgi:hypothetical protein
MVFEETKRPCMSTRYLDDTKYQSCGNWHSKTIYQREIIDRSHALKEVKRWGSNEKVTRYRTTHKMRWVKVGTLCSICLHIDYDSDWLEENKKNMKS